MNVYKDCATTPTTFQVTVSSNNNGAYTNYNAALVEFGLSSADLFGSFDMDFYSYKRGVVTPVTAGSRGGNGIPTPELSSFALVLLAISALCKLRQSRFKTTVS